MSSKSYKVPVIMSVGFHLLAVLTAITVTIIYYAVNSTNAGFGPSANTAIPFTLFGYLISFVFYLIYMLVVLFYKGKNRRLLEIVIFIVMGLMGFFSSVYGLFMGRFLALAVGGQAYAMTSVLNSYITMFATLFSSLAYLFMIIGVARFGVSERSDEEEEEYPES